MTHPEHSHAHRRASSRRHNSLGSSSLRLSRHGSAEFLLQKDLERREEGHKLKLAAFLRELHRVALDAQKASLQNELNHNHNHSTTTTTTSSNHSQSRLTEKPTAAAAGDKTHFLSFTDDDNDNDRNPLDDLKAFLTPARALHHIDQLHNGNGTVPLEPQCLTALMTTARQLLMQEETVVTTTNATETTVVGDLHGSLPCLQNVVELARIATLHESSHRQVVFIGDFVDRGQQSLPVLITLLLLKVSHPTQVYLVRGNHEDTMTASTYGFRDELQETYDDDTTADELWYDHVGPLFAALPLAVQTRQACLLHGGLPGDDFDLVRFNRQISIDLRCQLKTVADPYDDDEALVQTVLWSDPAPDEELGLVDNERGAGVTFGPDISQDFLERHSLRYLIRAHEPFEDGFQVHHEFALDETKEDNPNHKGGVITVFSSANYPNGEGTNKGAVLVLNEETGAYTTPTFQHSAAPAEPDYETWLTSIVHAHKKRLVQAFREESRDNNKKSTVTTDQWIDVLSSVLDLADVPWIEIQPDLAPTVAPDVDEIDWKAFLKRFTPPNKTDILTQDLDPEQLELLHEHHDKFLELFRVLDTDESGALSKSEFVSGIQMLNEQIAAEPEEKSTEDSAEANNKGKHSSRASVRASFKDPDKMFQKYDIDGDGEISIQEFCRAVEKSKTLKTLAKKLKTSQLETLHEHHEMLLMAFKFMDADQSGDIDWNEFETGITLLNKRLGKDGRHVDLDPKELWDALDSGKSGTIDIVEFHRLFDHAL
mmetsp:Transcript_489/g.1376  ORF Transcript_489/g.1376 Transcript_489/m.1376 type:complete len:768 (-) Transcript_489:38-2341(-)